MQIIHAAEQIFSVKGFSGTSLRDVANRLGMQPASLYYHFPRGKEEIYLEVLSGRLNAFKEAIERFSTNRKTLDRTLKEFGYWYVDQSPMNMALIAEVDMPYLSVRGRKRVTQEVGLRIFAPLRQLFSSNASHLCARFNLDVLVGAFTTLLSAVPTGAKMGKMPAKQLVDFHVELFLYGASHRRSSAASR